MIFSNSRRPNEGDALCLSSRLDRNEVETISPYARLQVCRFRVSGVVTSRLSVWCFFAILIMSTACSAGPSPQPVDDEPPRSGEQTARSAGESAQDHRDTILYATSRPDPADDVDEDDETEQAIDEPPILTLHFDAEGRFIDPDGQPVDVSALGQRSDEPLEGRAIQLLVDPDASELPIDAVMPILEAIHDQGAFVDVTSAPAPEVAEDDPDDDQPREDDSDDEERPDEGEDDAEAPLH